MGYHLLIRALSCSMNIYNILNSYEHSMAVKYRREGLGFVGASTRENYGVHCIRPLFTLIVENYS